MASREGVIKFSLDFRPGAPPAAELLRELNAWRTIFCRLGLLGCDPARYQGLGFGNLSRRAGGDSPPDSFIISGTQTGWLARLGPEHYVTVLECDPTGNRVVASGPLPPSSEALSHGVLYRSDPAIHWVMHLHSPEIFAACSTLALPTTDPAVPYGSPGMAAEIHRLAGALGRPGILVMGGHEDGVLAFGETASATGELVIGTLAAALVTANG